ncbi:MAG TPA: hypothetical protein VFY73_24355 [Ideonella sp.]|uniref:hypothetical protein n=1 Tax=Ideonella sp. TaxID=1929293 RepID=UPI002E369E10|nr:hypothetical protein [Ideonella sp.]HEX5687160.1 hypothetical protein [Ideonella sp.]
MNRPTLRQMARRSASLMAAGLMLTLGACSALQPADAEQFASNPPLAPGWQEHTSPLYNLGPGPTAGTTVWMVSALLPRGNYQVISRQGDRARILEGHRFEVDGTVNKEIRLILPFASGSLEAVEERYVIAQASTKPKTKP